MVEMVATEPHQLFLERLLLMLVAEAELLLMVQAAALVVMAVAELAGLLVALLLEVLAL
jgi:hypothetical protein